MIGAIFLALNFISYNLTQIGFNIPESSIINDLILIDYAMFYKIGFLTFMTTFSLAGVIFYICTFFLSEKKIDTIMIIMLRFSSVSSIVIPMLFVLTKEQFNVLTTIVSFLALFSFVIPKEIFKNSKKENVKKTDKEKPTEKN